MKQTAVEFIRQEFLEKLTNENYKKSFDEILKQAKEMEREQIIEAGNSCAFKQHLHSDRINKMTMDELEQYNLEPSYTFGEEHYYETFKK